MARISSDKSGRREGVDAQERWGRAYAERTWPGHPVVVYADNDVTAADPTVERPEYEAFRAAVRVGMVAQVWAVEQSRLERTEVGWFALAAELDAAGITHVHTNRDGIVQVRGVVSGIKAVVAAEEVRRMRERLMDRQDEIAAQGRPAGVTPWGYRRAEVDGIKTYLIDDDQADAIRWAADHVLAGWSLANVARELRDRGLVGARGGRVSPNSVRSALTSPAIAGRRVHRGLDHGPGNWQPILDMPTFRSLQALLAAPRTVRRSDGQAHAVTGRAWTGRAGRKYLLTGGLAVCGGQRVDGGDCGAKLSGTVKQLRSGGRSYERPYLLCRKELGGCGRIGIMLDAVEDYVVDEMWRELDKPEFLALTSADQHQVQRDGILSALDGIDTQRRELAALWAEPGELTGEEWRTARRRLDEREGELRAELAAMPPPVVALDVAAARESWDDMTLGEQRALVRIAVDRVTIHPAKPGTKGFDDDRVTIGWRYSR